MDIGSARKQATEKIEEGLKAYKGDRYGEALKRFAANWLTCFSDQSEEFAQAVVDGGSFKDCMDSICKGIGAYISDLDVAKRAAEYYFPGCDVKMQMSIYTSVFEREEDELDTPAGGGIILDLGDFL